MNSNKEPVKTAKGEGKSICMHQLYVESAVLKSYNLLKELETKT